MRYLALVYGNDEIWSGAGPDEFRELVRRVDAFNREHTASGELVAVEGLVAQPRSVRRRDGVPVVSDGPYVEAKEFVGSYFVLDVESLDRALEVVSAYPAIGEHGGGVEVWPLMGRTGDAG